MILLLLLEIRYYAETRIELKRNKKQPTDEDLNPKPRFIENPIFKNIENNSDYNSFIKAKKISWVNYPELIKNIYNNLITGETYKAYMDKESTTYNEDKKFIINILIENIVDNDLLYSELEEQSIYWNDDIEFIISMVKKTIEGFSKQNESKNKLLKLYKGEDDKQFVYRLFLKTITNRDDNMVLIEKFLKNWKIDRLAFIDVLLIEMAITEIKEFEEIPVKVTFNEYIDLAKYYSTKKSHSFVNGMLEEIIKHMKDNNAFKKKGRGLIGEI